MEALSALALMPETPAQKFSFFTAGKTELLEGGEADLIKFKMQLKVLTDLCKMFNDDKEIKAAIITECLLNPEHEIVSYQERAKYDFSGCNDEELTQLLEYEIEVKKAIADRKVWLKTIKDNYAITKEQKPKEFFNADGSEIMPAIKGKTDVVSVKFKK